MNTNASTNANTNAMNRKYYQWHSPNLQRDMELLVFGHAGAKVLVFPTRDGHFYEYEDLGLVSVLQTRLDAGQLQLFCVDSVDHESLYCFWRHPADRIQRHIQFEEYLLNEVMPLMNSLNTDPCTIAHGCSLGAFHATNIAFRHPHLFKKLVAFSGRYDLTFAIEAFNDLFDGYYDENIYFNSPSHFIDGLTCEKKLQALREMDIVMTVGREDPFLDNNLSFSHQLIEKDISHEMHLWDGRAHRAQYWRKMTTLYI